VSNKANNEVRRIKKITGNIECRTSFSLKSFLTIPGIEQMPQSRGTLVWRKGLSRVVHVQGVWHTAQEYEGYQSRKDPADDIFSFV